MYHNHKVLVPKLVCSSPKVQSQRTFLEYDTTTASSVHPLQMKPSHGGHEGYTTVQTVFSVVSNLTAFASVGFMFVSYMGFSNDACPLVFS